MKKATFFRAAGTFLAALLLLSCDASGGSGSGEEDPPEAGVDRTYAEVSSEVDGILAGVSAVLDGTAPNTATSFVMTERSIRVINFTAYAYGAVSLYGDVWMDMATGSLSGTVTVYDGVSRFLSVQGMKTNDSSAGCVTVTFSEGEDQWLYTRGTGAFEYLGTMKSRQISFSANGGTGTMTAENRSSGCFCALPLNGFTRVGYTFAGWATTASGNVEYGENAQFYVPSGDGAIVLYARWTEIVPPHSFADATTALTAYSSGLSAAAANVGVTTAPAYSIMAADSSSATYYFNGYTSGEYTLNGELTVSFSPYVINGTVNFTGGEVTKITYDAVTASPLGGSLVIAFTDGTEWGYNYATSEFTAR